MVALITDVDSLGWALICAALARAGGYFCLCEQKHLSIHQSQKNIANK
jgi:hypothetical protein